MFHNCLFWAQLLGLPRNLYCNSCKKFVSRARVSEKDYSCVDCRCKLIFKEKEEEKEIVFEYFSPT